jgi:hypothetical protein
MPTLSKADQKARISQNEARRRKEVALAKLRELEAREKEGKLISREHALQVWSEALGRIRDRCLAVPDRMAPQLVAIIEVTEIRNKLRHEMEDLLTGLSKNAI